MSRRREDIERMRKDAARIFHGGLAAVEPAAAVDRFCRRQGASLRVGDESYDLSRVDRIFVVGGGKAGAPMAAALERLLGDRIEGGLVVVKYGHVADLARVRLVEAGHPEPDANGEAGAAEIMNLVKSAGERDLILCVLSGGGSALLPLPAPGLTLADKQAASRALIACGASIHEINAVRKHISGIKGGRLARAAHPAPLTSLILSDVVGDDLDVIASGPAAPDASTFADCAAVIEKHRVRGALPEAVVHHIEAGLKGEVSESPKQGDTVFNGVRNTIIGSNIEAILAAETEARALGYHTLVLSSMIQGDTSEAARFHAALAREIVKTGRPLPRPACILSGGETTVQVTGKGLGGRNQEFALAAAPDIAGPDAVLLLSAGTDGTDGPTDAAGAFAHSDTIRRAEAAGLDPARFLSDNDAYHFFDALGDLFKTGPTNTNVMDLRIVLAV
ncbi:MAG: glycerate kinase [Desulfobacterales bacterium]|nr:glycerate kinase [Desulfobacterales bacterium]